jgi:hypothetical protein
MGMCEKARSREQKPRVDEPHGVWSGSAASDVAALCVPGSRQQPTLHLHLFTPLSGWYCKASFLCAFLISCSVAFLSTLRIL